jgi:hypothetical protein
MRWVPPALLALLALLPSLAAQVPSDEVKAEYARRYQATDQKNVAQVVELALWCQEKQLTTYANMLLKRALKLDPKNPEANRAVGNVEVDGAWYTPAEAEALAAKRAAEKAAADAAAAEAARPRGALELPDETASRAAVKSAIENNAADATRLHEAYAKAIFADPVKYAAAIGPHSQVLARGTLERAQKLAEIADYVWRRVNWLSFGKLEDKVFPPGGRMTFYMTEDPALEPTMEYLRTAHPDVLRVINPTQEAKDLRQYKLEFTTQHVPPIHVHLNVDNQLSAVANVMARTWLQYHARAWYAEPNIASRQTTRDVSMMGWLLEGLAIWCALDATGTNRLYRIETPKYAGHQIVGREVELDYVTLAWEAVTTGKTMDRSRRTLFELSHARLDSWTVVDLVMAFALADYIVRARPEDWRAWLPKLEKEESFRVAFILQFGTP